MSGAGTLRPMVEADLDLIRGWRNHPEVRRWMYTTHEIGDEEHRRWFEDGRRDPSKHLLVFERDGEPAGFVSLTQLRGTDVAEWGFYLAPGAPPGSGAALGEAALEHAFEALGLHKVSGHALADNERSVRFHLRLGFRDEGLRRDHHQAPDGSRHSVACFGLLAEEWRSRTAAPAADLPDRADATGARRGAEEGAPGAGMTIEVLTSDRDHPVVPQLEAWVADANRGHAARLCYDTSELRGGDVLFLVSCAQIVGPEVRARYAHCLVLHASDLPRGRGWSPHVWELLAGAEHLTLSLLDAQEPVDSGAIWAKLEVPIDRSWLFEEISAALFDAELALMDRALVLIAEGHAPTPQPEEGSTYHRRRRPSDSELDPRRPLAELFDLLRVADPVRYPGFFELRGRRYIVQLKAAEEDRK